MIIMCMLQIRKAVETLQGKAYWENSHIRQAMSTDPKLPQDARIISPEISQGLRWKITAPAVKAEMQRQGLENRGEKCEVQV